MKNLKIALIFISVISVVVTVISFIRQKNICLLKSIGFEELDEEEY